MELVTKNISALPGNPSTFWSSDNGNSWYCTKAEAETGEGKVVNPDDYIYTKSFWSQNKKTILVCAAITLIIGLLFYMWHKGVITFHVHKG